jgi:outer membrane immunogenic protein
MSYAWRVPVIGALTAGILSVVAAAASAAEPSSNYDWSGIYLGGHVGYAWAKGSADWTANPPVLAPNGPAAVAPSPGPLAGSVVLNPDGFIGGGQLGYNFVFGPWVLGLEGSLTGGNLDKTISYSHPGIPPGLAVSATTDIRWIAMVTPRIGYSWDKWLAYAKGGYAAGGVTIAGNANGSVFGGPISVSIEHKERLDGWTVGGGLEYGFSRTATIGVEYDYVSLGGGNISGAVATPGGPATYHASIEGHAHMLTMRLNFKFD